MATKAKPVKHGKKIRRVVGISLGAVLLVIALAALFGVPAYVSSDSARETILAKINAATGGKADFSNLSMGWLEGISVKNVSFEDDSGGTLVKVREISTRPHYASLLAGNLSFGKTVIDEPRVQLDLRGAAKETPRVEAPQAAGTEAGPLELPVKAIDLVVNDGQVAVTGRDARTVQLTGINSNVNLRPPGQTSSFDVKMEVTDDAPASTIGASGTVEPQKKTGWTLKGTNAAVAIDINDLDLATLAPLFELAGLDIEAAGKLSADFDGVIEAGDIRSLAGKVTASALDVTGEALKGDHVKTASLVADVQAGREKDMMKIDKLDVKTDWLTASASGTLPMSAGAIKDFTKGQAPYDLKANMRLDVAAAAAQMPNTLGIKEGTKVTAGTLDANIQASTQGGSGVVKANAGLAGLAGVVDGKQVSLSAPVTAVVEMTSDEKTTRFDKLNVASAFANINCTGTLEAFRYGLEADLAKMQSELGQFVDMGGYQTSGRVTGDGTLSIGQEAVTLSGTSALRDLVVASPNDVRASEPSTSIQYAGAYDRKKQVVSINSLTVAAGFGEVGVKDARIPIAEGADEPIKMLVSAKNIDLAKVTPFIALAGALPEKMQLSGMAESQVFVSGTAKQYTVTTDMTTITNFRLATPGKTPFEQKQVTVAFDGTLDRDSGAWDIKKLQLLTPDIKIRTDGLRKEVKADGNAELKGAAQAEYDWSAVSNLVSAYLPQGLKIEGKRQDTVSFSSTYPAKEADKMLANLNAEAKLGFDKAQYQGLNIGKVDVDVKVRQGVMTIAPFSTTVNQGQLNFAAKTDFNAAPPLFETPGPMQIIKDVQITDEMTNELLKYVNPLFANAVNVRGIANFSCEKLVIPLAEHVADKLDIAGTISLTDVRLEASNLLSQILTLTGQRTGEDITVRPTQFVARNGFLKYDNMELDIGNRPLNFSGAIGITERDNSLDMNVILPVTLAGTARVTLPLGGTIDKPKLDTSKLIQENIEGAGQELLRDVFKDLLKKK